jgi:hypothetical protein
LEAFHTSRKRCLAVSLHDQMQVVAQYAEVHQSKSARLAPSTQSATHDKKTPLSSQ